MDSIKNTMSEMMEMLHKKMSTFEEELQKSSNPSSSTDNLASDFAAFKAFTMQALNALQKQIEIMAHNQDQFDMRSRRKMILLHGIPESKNEDSLKVVFNIVKEYLKLESFTVGSIQRCHRLGRSPDTKRNRPILVKLNEVKVRDELWFQKTKLKGSEITMSEFLTKSRHDIFMAARLKFGVSKCWTREGQIFILGPDQQRHRISSLNDLNKLSQNSKNVTDAKSDVAPKGTTIPPKIKRAATSKK
ncbi:hypothetical protein K1T71_015306 [Dendrolimus kikuchii]|nr:hypothetical protein K1T71_015306 [Dendrolimus kikuchii]